MLKNALPVVPVPSVDPLLLHAFYLLLVLFVPDSLPPILLFNTGQTRGARGDGMELRGA
jgi:hypothetical protein